MLEFNELNEALYSERIEKHDFWNLKMSINCMFLPPIFWAKLIFLDLVQKSMSLLINLMTII